jgi:hypothetical protein
LHPLREGRAERRDGLSVFLYAMDGRP